MEVVVVEVVVERWRWWWWWRMEVVEVGTNLQSSAIH